MSEPQRDSRRPAAPPAPPAAEPRKLPAIPPREPDGEAEWLVTVRHTALKVRRATVKAAGRKAAWLAFLDLAEKSVSEEAYRKDGSASYAAAREWLMLARRNGPGADVEIIGAEYSRERVKALRVKGVVTQEQVGFPELASA